MKKSAKASIYIWIQVHRGKMHACKSMRRAWVSPWSKAHSSQACLGNTVLIMTASYHCQHWLVDVGLGIAQL
jgi:hypothetical protein